MHRSGTSFVASLLRQAGIDMGSHLLPASHGNDLGHFENVEFLEFHRRQLALRGYDDSGWLVPGDLIPSAEACAEASAIVDRNARRSPWGWKDPRTTLFLNFWLQVSPQAQFIFVYREPAEVVDSLFRRGDKAIRAHSKLAVLAWLFHNEKVLQFARANRTRCIIASLEAIVHDSRAFLSAIAERFGFDIDVDTASTYEPRALHTQPKTSPRRLLLRYFVPEVEALYRDLQIEADLPAESTPCGPISKDAVFDAFLSNWMGLARNATASTHRSSGNSGSEIGDAVHARFGNDEFERLRKDIDDYQHAVASLCSQIDRCLGDSNANQPVG
jgi:hypothetical protein